MSGAWAPAARLSMGACTMQGAHLRHRFRLSKSKMFNPMLK